MKRNIIFLLLFLSSISAMLAKPLESVTAEKMMLTPANGKLILDAQLILDSLRLKSSQQIFMTPVIVGQNDESSVFPTVLVTGRGMHYAYERGTMPNLKEYKQKYDILNEVRRFNGKSQKISYMASVPMEKWMRKGNVTVRFLCDSCGCGVPFGSGFGPQIDTTLNPIAKMRAAYITPKVTEIPITFHEGSARVQFEVNKTILHDSVYRCRSGQRIDNRQQLKIIYDSIAYALTDPNVDITSIEIIGYASPESPYLHNKDLAIGRSEALANFIGKYVGKNYNIPTSVAKFDAVPENWEEFRQLVVKSNDISDVDRQNLLDLIDRPAFTPSDFDAKEKELNSDPRFKNLYRKKILPEWFPLLRATKFRIGTQLKPMSDEKLAEVIRTSPEKMSLNQMMRVARLYPEGSDDFNKVIETALKYFPDNEEANLNAAAAAINIGEYSEAEKYLQKAGNSPEAINAKAILMVEKGDFDQAMKLFESINSLPEAHKNYNLLRE